MNIEIKLEEYEKYIRLEDRVHLMCRDFVTSDYSTEREEAVERYFGDIVKLYEKKDGDQK